ncbi:rhamnan synthesis F family protein [Brevundimonas diminuta]|uniref:Probable glycosyl transferase n=1 Tax=Brevundimonas diminuta 3F5N TaxID=1255603 RepID=A0A1R4GCH3_BREDI|nr:rhamnan synthesis F family protein [Brevundimonas diminuta]MDM8353758.1 rhamnan synthesis F family protein [Brevundimonas diminuta]SJM65891.1 probable glycosyl transferase [Brevundimonas diminuta 3F5N]
MPVSKEKNLKKKLAPRFSSNTEFDKRGRPSCAAYFDEVWYSNAHLEGARTADAWGHYIAHAREPGFDPNPAFDSAWYAKRFMSKADKRSPLTHYVQQGRREGASPSPWFDPWWYLKVYADVGEAGVEPLHHYLVYGAAERRSPGPYFDAAWYVARHPEVASLSKDPLKHYLAHVGISGFEPNPLEATPADAAMPSKLSALFDAGWYLSAYPDIAAADIDPVWHYLEAGRYEGRKPNPFFDPNYYVRNHPEVALEDALGHYVIHGRGADHDPCPFFASAWYAETYLGDAPNANPLQHYLEEGGRLGYSPHPLFDEARYLKGNADVAKLVRNGAMRSGYYHFVRWGAGEIENGNFRHLSFTWGKYDLDYDAGAYATDNPDVAKAISSGQVHSRLEHLFVYGWREAMDGLRAIYGPRHAVRLLKTVAGQASGKTGRYLCLFAHYDRDDLVDPYVVIYLKSLRAMDVDIVFITAVTDDKQLAKVKPLVSQILVKNEAGRDFGSWWLGLKTLGMDCGKGYQRVIFANDSIYFPVRPIAPLFADMEAKGYNFYGLSDSRDLETYHLQSFFLAFDARAQEVVFPEFMTRFERNYVLTKWGQIREYELGLTGIAQTGGLSVGAFFSSDDAREEIIKDSRFRRWGMVDIGLNNINPTHDLWDLVIGHYGWPGLKLELLRDNPKGATGFEALPQLIADGEVPIEVIEAHQKRSKEPAILVRNVKPTVIDRVALIKHVKGKGRDVADRLVLFAHYDPQAVIDPHVVYQVKALERAGCAVAFITSVKDSKELSQIVPHVRDVLIKTDAGRDFGSWDLAIKALKSELASFGSVIWMNDSTYFPLFDPKPMFQTMANRGADFWGIIDSENVTWHAMSWFWSFGRKAISDGWFDWYLDEYSPAYSKWAQIHNYEMRIPRLIKASGLKTDIYLPVTKMRDHILTNYPDHQRIEVARRGDFNIAHDFWREGIVDFQCPALKVELIRDNPLGIDIASLLGVVGSQTEYDPDLIRRHIARLKTAHLPSPAWADLGQLTARDS